MKPSSISLKLIISEEYKMSKSFKDRPDKYPEYRKKSKRKEERRFESSKGRSKDSLRNMLREENEISNPDYIHSPRSA